jgi:hypothetical protein
MHHHHNDSNNRSNKEFVKGESQEMQRRLCAKGNRNSMAKMLWKNTANE